MENKKTKVIIVSILTVILLIALLMIFLIFFNKQTSIPVDGMDSYISKEKLSLDSVSRIDIIYSYDKVMRDTEATKKIELSITGEQAKNLITLINKYEYPDRNNLLLYVAGDYQIILSNGVEFLFDSDTVDSVDSDERTALCIIDGEETLTEIPKELYDVVVAIVNSVLENNIAIYSTDKITIKQNNQQVTVTDEISVDYLLEQCKDIYDVETVQTQEIEYELIFNENTTIQVYKDKTSAKLINNGTEKYVKIPTEISSHIEIIMDNYNHNLRNVLETSKITIQQNGKTAEITDKNIINDIITFLNYSDIYYEDPINYNQLIDNLRDYDIMLNFDKVQIIISAEEDGILKGTSGNLVYSDKTTNLILIRDDFEQYMENLLKEYLK